MINFTRRAFLAGIPAVPLFGAKEKAVETGFPQSFIRLLPKDGVRFNDDKYFRFYCSNGLATVDPEALFRRVSDAAKSGNAYKALFLARLFTRVRPDLDAGWNNRKQIAASLQLGAEVSAAEKRAGAGGVFLSGAPKAVPRSLADYAAALALAADDLAALFPKGALAAVVDSVSGIESTFHDSLEPKQQLLSDLLPNLLAVTGGKPAKFRVSNPGDSFMATLSSVAAGVSAGVGDTAGAEANARKSGEYSARAGAVPSHYVDASFLAARIGGVQSQTFYPKSGGEMNLLDTPCPILVASGGSLSAFTTARFANREGNFKRFRVSRTAGTQGELVKHPPGTPLRFPRLMTLWVSGQELQLVSLLEAILDQNDAKQFGAPVPIPNLSGCDQAYTKNQLLFAFSNTRGGITGLDSKDVAYQFDRFADSEIDSLRYRPQPQLHESTWVLP